MLTGANNYRKCIAALVKLGYDPHLRGKNIFATQPKYAWLASGWFWKENQLDQCKNFKEMTRKINGGYHGHKEREQIYKKVLKA